MTARPKHGSRPSARRMRSGSLVPDTGVKRLRQWFAAKAWCFALGAVACTATPAEPVLGRVELDSSGVEVVRHGADAFARAPQWELDTAITVALVPTARISALMFETPDVVHLSNGAWAFFDVIGSRLVVFDAAGANPSEYWPGQIPGGSFNRPAKLITTLDTIKIVDAGARTVYRYTIDGFVRVDSFPGAVPSCLNAIGELPDHRLLARTRCADELDFTRPAPRGRMRETIVTVRDDFSDVRVIARLPGIELITRPTKTRLPVVELGQKFHGVVWGGTVVTATGGYAYALDVRTPDGTVIRRIAVQTQPRAVTPEMRAAVVKARGERIVADTMPPFDRVMVGADGLLWILDAMSPLDTTWAATAFREDGAVMGRLTGPGRGPIWFGERQVMRPVWREVDRVSRLELEVRAIVPRRDR